MPCGVAGFSISNLNINNNDNRKTEYMNQEIIIPVCDLKAALPGLSKIVGKSRTLPVLQSIRVSRDAEGKVSLMATDLDAFATYTVKEAQSGPGGTLPSGGAKEHTSQRTGLGVTDQVLQVLPDAAAVT
jgi:hypothetical protein